MSETEYSGIARSVTTGIPGQIVCLMPHRAGGPLRASLALLSSPFTTARWITSVQLEYLLISLKGGDFFQERGQLRGESVDISLPFSAGVARNGGLLRLFEVEADTRRTGHRFFATFPASRCSALPLVTFNGGAV